VEDYDQKTGKGTGFVFQEPSSEDLARCVRRALKNFHGQPKSFSQMVSSVMKKRFQGEEAGKEYLKLYRRALSSEAFETPRT